MFFLFRVYTLKSQYKAENNVTVGHKKTVAIVVSCKLL